jgi:hypothetical protein
MTRATVIPKRTQLLAVLMLGAAIVSWQLFIPPIIGLADQGDFVRVLGPLGYAPQPKGPEHKYWYVTSTYVSDPTYRAPRWEEITSELLPLRACLFLNRLSGHAESFNIRLIGATHAALFLAALFCLCKATASIPGHGLIWLAAVFVLTDVGYVAYWNSLYTEPASCLAFLFFLAESVGFSAGGRVSIGSAARWSVFAVLWIMAKTQNAPLCIPLAVYGFVVLSRTSDKWARRCLLVGVVAVFAAGTVMYRSRPPALRMTNLYNMIFYAILPESDNPGSDLKALGLNPDYVKYSGTLPWSENTGVADGRLVNAVLENVTPITIVRFYLQRPRRMQKHLRIVLANAFSLRPDFCGNFERSAGKPPGSKSDSFSVWSYIHERYFSRVGVFLIVSLLLVPVVWTPALILKRRTLDITSRRWSELGICLSACCAIAFFSAAFGDSWENIKHQFQFNLLLDACLVFGLAAGFNAVRRSKALGGRRNIDSVR